jgi:predicted O-linked N-acetylglucosamine transferase (SPINDLY family)
MLSRLFRRWRDAAAPAPGARELLAQAYAHHQAGRLAEAQERYRDALAADPHGYDAVYMLGVLALQLGRPEEAAGFFERAVGIAPESAPAHNGLGEAYRRLGRLDEALSSLRRAVALDARLAEAHYNLGGLLRRLGRNAEAVEALRRVVALNPEFADAHASLGAALHSEGALDEALASCQRALALDSASAAFHLQVGNLLREKGFLDEAAAAYRAALERDVRLAEAHNNLGNVLLHQGRADEALACYERALTVKPDFAEALLNAAQVMRENRRLADAAAACRLLLEMRPDMAEAHLELGHSLKGMGDVRGALACYEHALALDPEYAEARWAHTMSRPPMVAGDEAEQVEGRLGFAEELTALERWCALRGWEKAAQAVGTQQPFYLAYQDADHRESIARYGALCGRLMGGWQKATGFPTPARVARAEMRIGIVSAHIRDHSVWNAIAKGWLQHLDRARYDLRLFHLGTANDVETALAKSFSTHYAYGKSGLVEWTQLILGHQLDLLIFPEIGMDPTTAKLASLRLAPVQATSWGHPHTSGLPTMDYFLSADALEPPGAEAHYTESLVRLPGLGSAYTPSKVMPAQVDLAALGLRPDVPLLLCPGTPFKYTPRHDSVLVDIARRLGECQFVFFVPQPAELMHRVRQRLERSFAAAGLDIAAHAVFVPWLDRAAFYGLMREADVYLDTIGYSGFNTAMQAIECGLPIAAFEGRFLRGRLASGILRRMGLDELVATTDEAYVEIAVRLARDAAYWGALHERLEARRASLYGDTASVRALEAFFERALSRA